jgi:RNA polymerase subunit RPABC4/transcription elongation factor Spt4
VVDIIIILALILALAVLVIFKSLILALLVVGAALIAAFFARARPGLAAKGLRPRWKAKCPKCRNIVKSQELACGNCGAHSVRLSAGGSEKKLKCGRCDMAVANPKCPKCEALIAPRFWT